MCLIYGVDRHDAADRDQRANAGAVGRQADRRRLGIFFIVVGFAFKVSAVPFHFWAPDTYEGAPTPVTAFLSVASKAAGFVALHASSSSSASSAGHDVWEPLFWVLAALTMTVGNLIALRQTNIVRMLAYSSIAQAGYMLVPFAVAGDNLDADTHSALTAVIVYLLIYAAMNLGAFAVVIAVARKTRSGEITSLRRPVQLRAGPDGADDGLPVLAWPASRRSGGWFAKFCVFDATVLDSGTPAAVGARRRSLAVNSVIALYYYANVPREMWMNPVPDGDRTPVRVPASLADRPRPRAASTCSIGIFPRSSPTSATWPAHPRGWAR